MSRLFIHLKSNVAHVIHVISIYNNLSICNKYPCYIVLLIPRKIELLHRIGCLNINAAFFLKLPAMKLIKINLDYIATSNLRNDVTHVAPWPT